MSVNARNDTLPALLARIEAEFFDMPGLSVTLPQAQRLWGIDYPTSIAVFRALTDRGVVQRTPRGQYIRTARVSRERAAA